ncbi:hypothetical protein DPMN_130379 [Dreissena polymorpha]|uniref:Uncharacterized protein n=1 Tax=Dreissena polymorpha TaxID=45954 RepID=A0A9D4H7N4_DREPO|nr:hypothetical protein DPMN_130379 [Dreissena polymorpha]
MKQTQNSSSSSFAFQYCSRPDVAMNLTDIDDGALNVTTRSRLMQFNKIYADAHGYVSLCVCTFGIVTNLFNISGRNSLP